MQKKIINAILVLLVAGLAYLFNPEGKAPPQSNQGGPSEQADTTGHRYGDESELLQAAFAQRRSKVWATVPVKVRKTLADDNEGSRHQRFLVNLNDGQSILVAHNIDLAPRAPIKAGANIWIRGRYEWSDKGGVLHWTHHDPRGKKEGGWIEVKGKRYE